MFQPPFHLDSATSIAHFSATQWNDLIPRDEPQLRHDYLSAVEISKINPAPRYLALRDGNGLLVGVAVTYDVDIDLLTLASPKLHRLAQTIRRGPLRRFLIARSVTCGPMVTNCRSNLFLSPELAPSARTEAAEMLIQATDELKGGNMRVMFEHSTPMVEQFGPALEKCGYVQAASLPGTAIEVRWENFDAYTSDMRKFYRRAVRDDQNAAKGLEIAVETDFAHLAEEIHRLYLNVLERADSVFVRLTPQFFEAFAACEQSRLVTAREKSSGRLIGVELLFVGDTVIQDLYTGVDYSFNAQYHTYFNLIYPGIALACEKGFKTVSTGQTSYAFKSRLGVQARPLSLFIKHRNPLINFLIKSFKTVLCPVIVPPTHRVFHSDVHIPAPEAPVSEPPLSEAPNRGIAGPLSSPSPS